MSFPEPIRQLALQRARGRCEAEGCTTVLPILDVDHIKETWEGGTDTLDNAQCLCRACHKAKSRAATKRRAKADRQRRALPGVEKRPPKGRPLSGTKRSGWKHLMRGGWERR